MSDLETKVAAHYETAALLETIKGGLLEAGVDPEAPQPADLKGVDEFHLGGLEATEAFLDPLSITSDLHVLDIGSGIGGTARFLNQRYGARVTGVDLTPAFVDVASELNRMAGICDGIEFRHGSALDLPVADGTFDMATMLHVGMNIADKQTLFREASRALKPGGRFALFDLMTKDGQPFDFPVPWASEPAGSHVVPPEAYRSAASSVGLTQVGDVDRSDFGVAFFKRVMAAPGAPPPVGLHLIMGPLAQAKYGNVARAILDGRIAPWEMVFRKD